MNKTFFFALALGTAMASVACGDDTGTGGSADTSGTTATGGTKTTTAGNTTNSAASTTKAASSTTGMAGPPCAMACMGDAGCGMNPVDPGMACEMCVNAEIALGVGSTCAAPAGLGADCQADTDCKALVDCILAGMMTSAECQMANPEGAAFLREEIYEGCGNCGDGS